MDATTWGLLAGQVVALVTAAGAIWKSRVDARETARRSDLDTLRAIIDEQQQERELLRAQVDELTRREVSQQEQIAELRRAKRVLTQRITELAYENQRLHETIGELRERVWSQQRLAPGVVAMMRRVPDAVSDVYELAVKLQVPAELIGQLGTLKTMTSAIPVLVRMDQDKVESDVSDSTG